ncbi:SMP-30/gluconolactonase/LRE family protein [Priestia koreensis]|uniref:SMP-30/gluconolactonase/LRE family protein n=1 Tax=Priestia koreensis TaxID=284581 RepID=UPI00203D4C96|nr:SMP-30/gluconolactonase/LRE family protein [Priestia koreensis]MCM3004230.1 SMP-30/gluconolactonase/LRE family protein [Priestia koreensis]
MTKQVELVVDAHATLGEGPCWDLETQQLYWVDIEEKKLNLFTPSTGENKTYPVGELVGAVVTREKGGVVLAMQNGLHFFDVETGEFTFLHDPESHIENNRFNDGKCDPAGRFWIGTMDINDTEGKGSLYCLDVNQELTKKLDNVSISNGLAWSPDQKTLYYIDTPTQHIFKFDYDVESGEISNRKAIIDFTNIEGSPDGMTIDAEGMLWVAHWGGSRVSRWNPHTATLLEEIAVPSLNVTACTFGGENLDELYITTARIGTEEDVLATFPHAGGLYKVKPGVKGMAPFTYKG